MTKKILIVGPAYPLRGGLATYNQLLANKLKEEGHTVKLMTFKLQYPNFLFPGKTQYSTDPAPQGLEIDVALNSVNPFNWIRLGNKVRAENYDLVIMRYWIPFMGPCLGTLARRIRKNRKTKVVAITDNIIPHEPKFYDRIFTSYFLKSCDGFVTMSRSVLNDLKEFNITKPGEYNPHPMYESFGDSISKADAKEKLGLDPEYNYLLFFGFIRKYKGLDLLLNAFSDKRLRDKKVKLIIAGEYYDNREPYQKLIKELKLEEHLIQYDQFIPDTEVSTYFCASDMVVQTYKTATQSGVTQVAYYFNKPMLVTDVGGLAELVPHQKVGYVVDRDPEQIADALVDFYENSRESEFTEHVKVEREKFTWTSMIEKLLSI